MLTCMSRLQSQLDVFAGSSGDSGIRTVGLIWPNQSSLEIPALRGRLKCGERPIHLRPNGLNAPAWRRDAAGRAEPPRLFESK
jgi:hypothetical protein